MASTVLTSSLVRRTLPFQAILRHDLRTLRDSWLMRFWLIGTLLLTFVVLSGNWARLETAPLLASVLFPYLVFPWFLVVMVLGVNPVSGTRAEALADGFLSRPITRQEYLLAVWAARVVVVLAVYLVVMVPAVAIAVLAKRPPAPDHVTLYGIVAAMVVVGLVLVFQVSLAFCIGTLLRRPLVSVVVLLFLWYPVNMLLSVFQLESLSPISLNQALPVLLRQPMIADANAVGPADKVQLEAMQAQTADFFVSVLSGSTPPPRPPRDTPFYDNPAYKDFSLWRVLLGYGIPTFVAVGLSMLVFSLRDL
jgi:ABC-type transport system involved in multi-copper enzyme maturation permease subunit